MAVRHESKMSGALGNVLGIVIFVVVAGSALPNVNLTSLIFGVGNPAPPLAPIVVNPIQPAKVKVEQPVPQATSDGYERYTDKNGNEVVIVPARYQAKNESAPVQTAPVPDHSAVSPAASPPVTQKVNVPVQASPPPNLAVIAMNAAAKAHTGMNVFESCRCNNGLATKGDSRQEVLEKCAQPAGRFGGDRDCPEIWVYNFGPNEFMQGVCFDRSNRVTKVLSLDHGY
ncbi:DUF2845 domain-containing protein [Geomonas oryzisoli]|uniref:DUF2845 domain-containing protein n=1 Tax=Geomonas oryzisoli TaxID=2847992 RepID=A0ABX8J6Z7_9BACT|nr:DUF2845 domain-containing protein [Geomonas oryzisoli]QWV94219.1 DUF2845 domain-containing protein [Geomonas oryzisoli]